MKLAFAAIIVALASVTEVAAATTGTTSSPTPTRRLEGYRRFLPFWSPRSRRRSLSPITPAPTAAARKRDDSASSSIPTGPPVTDLWEIVEPFPQDIETESPGASPTATGAPVSSPSGLPSSASDSVWEDAASHGCRLVDAMRVSDYDAGQLYSPTKTSAQSSLMKYEDFTSWGWNANEVNGGNFTDLDGGQKQPDPGWGIGKALRDLGVSDKIKAQGGKNVIIDAVHGKAPFTQGYTKDGKTYPATGADFKIGINTDDGVLMAVDRISTTTAAKKRNPPVSDDQLPDVHTFSDIGYLNYKKMLGKDPTSFKYMMSLMITNEETASIISRALGGQQLRSWPGTSFNWRSKEFKALLGSPNGMGFGYLLVQHKSQLGKMFIKQVQVFHGDTWHHLPNMVFTLEEQSAVEPPPKSSGSPPQMEEPMMTGIPSILRRGEADTKIHIQGPKNFLRAHTKHMEL
ncbi:hypothetical protein P171DRAFT_469888 [Karstenula rhodostoma CBS 690.94]|uniref:Uncharacterized protein n=1 Tax=Karstenula rhodostoma CBS 690.94 TaxID=1392251 RepID=A0A9P4PRK5_9PLEO|nr:hypothetical protein P171DRAFT_469888 [Karstenula rhodostoma CBS 690.94]